MADKTVRTILWAVVVQGTRSRWIHWPSVRGTRRDAIRAYGDWCGGSWTVARQRGCTCEKVLVSTLPPGGARP